MITNCLGAPGQPFAMGVTTIVPAAVADVLAVFTATNEAMFPEPEAASPILVLLLLQLYTVLFTAPLKFTGAVLLLLHKV